MTFRKINTLSLTLAMTLLVTACNNNAEPSADAVTTTADTSVATNNTVATPQTQQYATTYRVATSGKQAPFSFQDEYGKLIGIDIDAINAIAEVEEFNVEFVKEPFTSNRIFKSIEDGSNDLVMSGISYSEERDEKYTLSDSYLYVPSAIMYNNPDYNIKQISDLEGLTIGGIANTKQMNEIIEQVPNINFVPTDTTYLAYEKLIRGEVDAIAEDLQLLEYFVKLKPEFEMTIVTYETEADPASQQVIMAKKGNRELINKINHGIGVLKASGEFKKIEEKWIGQQ